MCLWRLDYLSVSSSFHTSQQPLPQHSITQTVLIICVFGDACTLTTISCTSLHACENTSLRRN